MVTSMRLRSIQATLAAAYALLAIIAAAHLTSIFIAAGSVAMLLIAYLTGKALPDVEVRLDQVLGVCWLALSVMLTTEIAELISVSGHFEAAAIVMSYSAGNRLRAAGVGPAT